MRCCCWNFCPAPKFFYLLKIRDHLSREFWPCYFLTSQSAMAKLQCRLQLLPRRLRGSQGSDFEASPPFSPLQEGLFRFLDFFLRVGYFLICQGLLRFFEVGFLPDLRAFLALLQRLLEVFEFGVLGPGELSLGLSFLLRLSVFRGLGRLFSF